MSTYIESIIMLLLCFILYPIKTLDAFHITCILVLIALYCFMLVTKHSKGLRLIGIFILILTLFVPNTTIFLPLACYILFYHKQYWFCCLYALPVISFYFNNQSNVAWYLLALFALSFYLAYTNHERFHLKETIHTFRDASVETEMILKEKNRHLVESQNDQIYIATLKERNRIAREIHDNVGHMLSRSILQVGALLAICKDETLKPHLTTLKETLDTAMTSIRNSVHDLHDESIDLHHSLCNLTEHFTFCTVDLNCEVSKNVPKEIKYCFLTIVKEALNNTMKHSNATKVTITVKEHPAFYQLLVEDNGTTVSDKDSAIDTSGIGLSNMRERVNTLHGIIHISTEHGFRIFVSVPK